MAVIALQGLRGGAGATSLSAALGWAFNALQESVLLIDLSPANQLAAHFNLPLSSPHGWATAQLSQQPWQQAAQRYLPGLDFLPFGTLSHQSSLSMSTVDERAATSLLQALPALKKQYQWVILDLPADLLPWQQAFLPAVDRLLQLLTLDANCQLRLQHARFASNTLFLINQFNANSQLQQDLHQFWLRALKNLIPQVIHRDEALAEAPMMKQPVGEYRPHALVSEEINTLANWLMLNVAGGAA
ncbi:cellulose synthase operon protein YhjQ [Pantoea sp. Mb-10]|uniref:cellulose biosynthesis protein BcsQ n=1 Tax=unclassified Pantoea TaxID=2630326 RepID=UPI001E32528A|nr:MULTISPECIES: cellulose biosynthesis protein BcsQ [unclassified Pantoea]MCE0491690.1 cellulose synthase operon protein YhjQ [Pantoea sp. Mb-10]MCE0502877.1 cellulose synthase operon protein YhjQ [Pantoea sp. Pb-8]